MTFRKGPKKTDTMRFSSEWRATLLTEGLRFLQLGGNDSAAAATKVNNFDPFWPYQPILGHLSLFIDHFSQFRPNVDHFVSFQTISA